MSTAYIVTHTEASHHVDQIVGGWHDSELTDRGHRQAQAIADVLRNRIAGVPCIYSSDLKRARQTASAISAAFDVPIHFDPDLREASCGVAEGKPKAWLDARIRLPPATSDRLDHRICEGAETRRETGARVYRFVDKLLRAPPENAIVVTHGFAMSFVVFAWLQMPLDALAFARMPATSGGITTVAWNDWGDRDLVSFDETAHLA